MVHLRPSDAPEGRSDFTVAILSGQGLSSGLRLNSPHPLGYGPVCSVWKAGAFLSEAARVLGQGQLPAGRTELLLRPSEDVG